MFSRKLSISPTILYYWKKEEPTQERGRRNGRHSSLRIDGSPAIDVRLDSRPLRLSSNVFHLTSLFFKHALRLWEHHQQQHTEQGTWPDWSDYDEQWESEKQPSPERKRLPGREFLVSLASIRWRRETHRKDREKLTLSSLAMAYSVVNESSVSLISSYLVSISNSKKKRTKLTSSSLPSFLSRSRMRRRQTSLLRLPQITQSSSRIAPSGCS